MFVFFKEGIALQFFGLVPLGGNGSTGTSDPNPEKRDLTVDEKAALNKAKEAVKEKGCGASMAYEMVSANWSRYSYQVDPSLKGQAGYLNGTFYFNNASTIDAKYLTEEFIHAVQDLVYPNGINGLSRPNIEFEAKFLVEINGLFRGECCSNAQLGFKNVPEVMDKLQGWIAGGAINVDEYFNMISTWCNTEGPQFYGQGSKIDRTVSPELLNKLIKERSNCLTKQNN